jgi:hypothetical protein
MIFARFEPLHLELQACRQVALFATRPVLCPIHWISRLLLCLLLNFRPEGLRATQGLMKGTRYPALRLYDCAALALAEGSEDCILLTGDGRLRGLAEQQTIRVHGVLWAFDQIHQHATATQHGLQTALACWQGDNTVWLPAVEIQARLRRLSRGK